MKKLTVLLTLALFIGSLPVFAGSVPTSVMMTPVIVAASSASSRRIRETQELISCLQNKGGIACYEKSCEDYGNCTYQICMKHYGGKKGCSIKANPNYTSYMHCVNNKGGKACKLILNPYYENIKYCLRGNGGKACYSNFK